jgi:hypothetical protein
MPLTKPFSELEDKGTKRKGLRRGSPQLREIEMSSRRAAMNRTKILSILAGLTISVLLVATIGQAQNSELIRVDVPFDFWVQRTLMPAGQYRLMGLSGNAMLLRDSDRGKSVLAIINHFESAKTSDNESSGKLVFTHSAGDYYLREVWSSGNTVGRILSVPKTETRIAGGKVKPDQSVVVAALP